MVGGNVSGKLLNLPQSRLADKAKPGHTRYHVRGLNATV